jgi:GNAT superfamily N-acetyltransferase
MLDGEGMSRFRDLPERVYAADPVYCRPAPGAMEANLRRFAEADRLRLFLAEADGEAIGRVAAILHPALAGADGRPLGLLGYFEAQDRPAGIRELLQAAVAWLRERGAGQIVGPMNGDTWHAYRVNAGPFDQPPFFMEPYNPPYYQTLWQASGFRILESYCSKQVDDIPAVLQQLAKFEARAAEHGYRIRQINIQSLDDELRTLYRLSVAIFRENFLYTDISEAEFLSMYTGLRSQLVPSLIHVAEDAAGTPVGFVFAIPDYARAFAAMRGERGLLARLRFLMNRGRAGAVNIKTLGVVSSCRRSGLGLALMAQAYRNALALGYRRVNLCLIRDGNPSGGTDAGLGRELRRYHLYETENS